MGKKEFFIEIFVLKFKIDKVRAMIMDLEFCWENGIKRNLNMGKDKKIKTAKLLKGTRKMGNIFTFSAPKCLPNYKREAGQFTDIYAII